MIYIKKHKENMQERSLRMKHQEHQHLKGKAPGMFKTTRLEK